MTDLELNVAVANVCGFEMEMHGETLFTRHPHGPGEWRVFDPATDCNLAMDAAERVFGIQEFDVCRRHPGDWHARVFVAALPSHTGFGDTPARAICQLILKEKGAAPEFTVTAEVRPNVEGKTLVSEAVPVVSVCGGKSVAPIPAGKFDSTFREVEEARIRQIAREELAASGTAKVQRFMESLLECEHCKGAFSCLWPVKLTTTGETLKLCRKCSKKSADELRPASPGPETPLPPDPIRTFFNHHLGD
jgi:hypothetical protein